MSDPAKERFLEPAMKYQDAIKGLLNQYLPKFPPILLEVFSKADWIIWYFHPERYEEIQGMAEAAGVDTHLAIMMNYVYEFRSYCTSIVAR